MHAKSETAGELKQMPHSGRRIAADEASFLDPHGRLSVGKFGGQPLARPRAGPADDGPVPFVAHDDKAAVEHRCGARRLKALAHRLQSLRG